MEISSIKGIGEKVLTYLNEKGIKSFEDLITFYPINYQSYSDVVLRDKANITIKGTITREISEYRPRPNLTISTYFVFDGTSEYKVVAWNQKHLRFTLNVGDNIMLMGVYDAKKNQLIQKSLKKIDSIDEEFVGSEIKPIYSKVNRMSNEQIKKIILNAIECIDETTYKENLINIHSPNNYEELKSAKEYLKYREFDTYYKKLLKLKDDNKLESIDYIKDIDDSYLKEFLNDLEFELTSDQKNVVFNIINSLKSKNKTQTLVLGDVGSGKTIVSIIISMLLVKKGYQIAVMAPTEVLAKQLYSNFLKYLPNFNIDLLTSSKTKAQKNRIKDNILVSYTDILIGTHALIEDDVVFNNLGLAIIDEQHRFGVEQRNKLIKKTMFNEFLYLSATPIPRTLAQAVFGVMEVEFINSKPSNRKKIKTNIFNKSNRKEMFGILESELKKGNQAFIVAPTIEETEIENLENVESIYKSMIQFYGDDYNIGLIHGLIKSKNKDIIMEKFKNKEYDILVATTVIEVGVDIKDATVMIVINAERYGLAQLHQLRGRVGRDNKQSYCLLYDKSNNDISTERLEVLKENDDGFILANKDLKTRGSGDFFGSEQSGLKVFKLFNYYEDMDIAQKVIEKNSIK